MANMMRRIISFALFLAMAGLVFASSSQEKREKFGSSLSRFKRDQAHQASSGEQRKKTSGAGADDIRLDTLLVLFDVLVTDGSSRVATGLTKDDFVVTEDWQQQQVSMLERGELLHAFKMIGSLTPRVTDS